MAANNDPLAEDKRKLRQTILRGSAWEGNKPGISWRIIKKYVEVGRAGLVTKPMAKEILIDLIRAGYIIKIGKNWRLNRNNPNIFVAPR